MTDPIPPVATGPDPVPAGQAPIPESTPAVDPQVAMLVAQVQRMQAQIAAMHEAQGIPSNPVAAAAKNLQQHVAARLASGLSMFQELHDAVKDLGETVESKESDLARTIASELRDHVEGAPYVKDLANALHKLVLSN